MGNMIISYRTLRKVIGILGMALAFICIIGGLILNTKVQQSISAYYNTVMRDVLEGILITAGVFMMTYKGYDLKDNIVSWISGISAVGIAMFSLNTHVPHFIFSAIFFISLAYMSYFQFAKGKNIIRNRIYRICGIIIMTCLIIFPFVQNIPYSIITLETIMLEAFGISWLIKGIALKENI